MSENLSSALPPDGQQVPGLGVVREQADVLEAPRPWRSTCAGKVTWMTAPPREVSECVLPRGHRGDHRDARGYPWNEQRWAD